MSLLTSEQLKAATKYAKQDIKLLKKQGSMAITGTHNGVLMLEFENNYFVVFSNGFSIFSTDLNNSCSGDQVAKTHTQYRQTDFICSFCC